MQNELPLLSFSQKLKASIPIFKQTSGISAETIPVGAFIKVLYLLKIIPLEENKYGFSLSTSKDKRFSQQSKVSPSIQLIFLGINISFNFEQRKNKFSPISLRFSESFISSKLPQKLNE